MWGAASHWLLALALALALALLLLLTLLGGGPGDELGYIYGSIAVLVESLDDFHRLGACASPK
jgi:hypothetical protein